MTMRHPLLCTALVAACTSAADRTPIADSARPARPVAAAAVQPVHPDSIGPAIAKTNADPFHAPTDVQAGPVPDTVRAECGAAAAMVRSTLAIDLTRADGSYRDSHHGTSRVGCRMSGTGSFRDLKGGGPVNLLDESFHRGGWRTDVRFDAGGPDGSLIGVRRRDILCMIRGSWDGGDDSEPDTAASKPDPDPTYEIAVECARDVPSNTEAGVPDSLWSVARLAGLDSVYAISLHMRYPPYTTGDFDADGVSDVAVLVEHRASGKLGIAIVRRGARTVTVLGAGSGGAGPDDLDGVREWAVFGRDITMHVTIGYRPESRLIADALWIERGGKRAGFYLWTGSGYVFELHIP